MISIQTVNSKIYKGDGQTLMDGHLVIVPSEAFEFTESGVKRKVSLEPIQVPITSGAINAFSIAPTIGASQDKVNLYFIARFYSDSEGADWTEYWQLDAAGSATLEIPDIARVEVNVNDEADPTLDADDVTATPTASKVPRAGATGKLDAGWIPSVSGSYPSVYVQATEPSPAPASNVVALWMDTSVNQIKVWDGTAWRAFA